MNISKKTLIVLYLIIVVVFAWQSAKQKAAPLPPPVMIIADATSYTLPATPLVSLKNTSDKEVVVDTCRDIEVIANGVQKTTLPPTLCRTVKIPAQSIETLF